MYEPWYPHFVYWHAPNNLRWQRRIASLMTSVVEGTVCQPEMGLRVPEIYTVDSHTHGAIIPDVFVVHTLTPFIRKKA